jgi:hypothetical protein
VPQRGFRTKVLVVVTTLLDAREFPKADLANLYRQRWQAEISQPHYGARERLSLTAA